MAELTANGLEEDSREDSAEIKLFFDDDDDDEEGDYSEGEKADDSLVFSKTSIAEALADAASKVHEASSVSTPTADIVAESAQAREEWAKLHGASDRAMEEPSAETRKEARRIPRSRPLSIRLSANKKKAWNNAWDEAKLASDVVAIARWHGEDGVVAQKSSDLLEAKHIGEGSACREMEEEDEEKQIRPISFQNQGKESQASQNGESTQKDHLTRTANTITEEQDEAPSGSPELDLAQALPPRDKMSLSSSPPLPIKKAEIVGVSLSQHLAATGAKGGNGMPKPGCEGSIRTMETACSTNPSEDDFVPSPHASVRKNARPDALIGTSARSRRRALEAQFSKHTIRSSRGDTNKSQKDPAASLESARSLEVAILQSLKKKVDDSIGTSATSIKTGKAIDTAVMMERIKNERTRVKERSKSLRRLESAPQQVSTSAPDWNVW